MHLDHVTIRTGDLPAAREFLDPEERARLHRPGIRHSPTESPGIAERRPFFPAPGGPLLEAVLHEPTPEETTR